MDLSRLRHYKTAEAGNKPSYEAGKLYLLQIFLEMAWFLNIQEIKPQMLAHVLIQTVATFEILKSYRGFCIFLPIKDYNVRLRSLELWTRSQFLEMSF